MSLQQTKKRKQASVKEEEVDHEDEVEDEKNVKEEEASDDDEAAVKMNRNDEGDAYVELSSKRRMTVRTFKKKVLVDIREVSRCAV